MGGRAENPRVRGLLARLDGGLADADEAEVREPAVVVGVEVEVAPGAAPVHDEGTTRAVDEGDVGVLTPSELTILRHGQERLGAVAEAHSHLAETSFDVDAVDKAVFALQSVPGYDAESHRRDARADDLEALVVDRVLDVALEGRLGLEPRDGAGTAIQVVDEHTALRRGQTLGKRGDGRGVSVEREALRLHQSVDRSEKLSARLGVHDEPFSPCVWGNSTNWSSEMWANFIPGFLATLI